MIDTVENCQENLCLDLEYDHGYDTQWRKDPIHKDVDELIGNIVIVINGSEDMAVDGIEVYSVAVDESYQWNLSNGQQELYHALSVLQSSATYSLTTVRKLAESMGLKINHAAHRRLQNLQSLRAIQGFKG